MHIERYDVQNLFFGNPNASLLRKINNCTHEQGLGAKGIGKEGHTTCPFNKNRPVVLKAKDAVSGDVGCDGAACEFRKKLLSKLRKV